MLKVLISTSMSTDYAREAAKNVSNFFNRFDDSIVDIFTTVECLGKTDRYDNETEPKDVIPVRQEFLEMLRETDILIIIPKHQQTTYNNISMSMGESVSWEYTIANSRGIPVIFWDLNNKETHDYILGGLI